VFRAAKGKSKAPPSSPALLPPVLRFVIPRQRFVHGSHGVNFSLPGGVRPGRWTDCRLGIARSYFLDNRLAGAVESGGCDLRANEYAYGQRTAELIVAVIRLDADGTADLDQMDRLGLLELISYPVMTRMGHVRIAGGHYLIHIKSAATVFAP
jgi:hypothetical protein